MLPPAGNERRPNEANEETGDAKPDKPDKPAATCSGEDEDAKAKDAAKDAHTTKEQAAKSHGAQSFCFPLAPPRMGYMELGW